MQFNYGYARRVFEKEQAELRKEFLAAGMSEEAIQEMYAFDKAYFNLLRKEKRHAAEPQEMITTDSDTGELRYKDMDEFPTQESSGLYQPDIYAWIDEIEDKKLLSAIQAMPQDYVEIISLLMQGFSLSAIGRKRGVKRAAMCNKLSRIKIILRK